MAQIAFVVNVGTYKSADLGNFLKAGKELVRQIAKDLPISAGTGGVRLEQILKSDSKLVPDVYAAISALPTNVQSARAGTVTDTTTVVAGGGAGNITVTGVKTTDRLISVNGVKDSDQTVVDFLTGAHPFTISATDTINNTSGTSSSGYHLVVVTERT